jgi:hypothetical protein
MIKINFGISLESVLIWYPFFLQYWASWYQFGLVLVWYRFGTDLILFGNQNALPQEDSRAEELQEPDEIGVGQRETLADRRGGQRGQDGWLSGDDEIRRVGCRVATSKGCLGCHRVWRKESRGDGSRVKLKMNQMDLFSFIFIW